MSSLLLAWRDKLKEEGFLIGEITYITDDYRLKNSVIKLEKINLCLR